MTLLLDTHILLHWLLGSRKLDADHRRAIERVRRKGERLAISAISDFEIALLVAGGRLEIDIEGVWEQMDAEECFETLPLTREIAWEACNLGSRFHRDPADQLIVATARMHRLKLVTADERIRESKVVEVL